MVVRLSLHFIPKFLIHLDPLRYRVGPLLDRSVGHVVLAFKIHIVVAGNELVQVLRHALTHERQLFSVVEVIWVHWHEAFYVNLYVSAGIHVSIHNVLRDGCRNGKELLR